MSAAKLAAVLAGESPANRRSPDAVVVISSSREGDRPVESLEVKAPVGRLECRSDPYRGASNRAGRNDCVNQVASKITSRVKRIADFWECRAGLFAAKATPTSPTGTDDDRALRGLRGRHARKERAAKARNHSGVA